LVERCLMLTMGMAALLGVSLLHDAWQWSHPPQPLYFLTNGMDAPRISAPLSSPVVDDTQMLQWTVQAILAPYNVDYFNYPKELNTASRKFTVNGWNSFANSFIFTGDFDELKRARLLCHAQQTRAALIHSTRYLDGALAYEIEVPIVQTCENVNQTSTNNLLVTATVIRTDSIDHPDGLAIDQLVASPE
jgi:intracellular multiplication protein IcmL